MAIFQVAVTLASLTLSVHAKPNIPHSITLGDLNTIADAKVIGSSSSYPINFLETSQGAQYDSQQRDGSPTEPNEPNEAKKSLRRINLDMSGRIMCHLFSPNRRTKVRTTPLFYGSSQTDIATDGINNLQQLIPRVYIGANYDLDEIWYGATRWIARCSWDLSLADEQADSSMQNPVLRGAKTLASSIFRMQSPASNWVLDVEGERSVFDSADSTMRIRLVQPSICAAPLSQSQNECHSAQSIMLEYDSAKYIDNYCVGNSESHGRDMQYSPAVKLNIHVPLLHPRLEAHSRHTWIVKEGGDRRGNYYGGAYFGSESPADRRFQQMKEQYREGIPQSAATDTIHTPTSSIRAACSKLSSWLENDGWMPQKLTTDLMGNFVSINHIGFGSLRNDIGLKVRISKKIDWSKLGVFPWSNNIVRGDSNNHSQAAKVRIELYRLNKLEDLRAWIAVEANPLDAVDTFKCVVGRESISK